MAPLGRDPHTQLGAFAVSQRNIAVPADFAIVGKLAQTVFPGGAGAWYPLSAADARLPLKSQAFQCDGNAAVKLAAALNVAQESESRMTCSRMWRYGNVG
jgi:hypothetical protein